MISCPGCGANLRFDIQTQQMKCDYCGELHDPYEFETVTDDARAERSFDALVYSCPGCGAELLTTEETEATAFCPYCGNTSILFDRLRKVKYPSAIVPFKLTKENCKRAYQQAARKAVFTPARYKKAELVDSFRGIYMPYWSYHVDQKGTAVICADGATTTSGDYEITGEYALDVDIDLAYDGYSHDASKAFDDEISECLEPFEVAGRRSFTPGFLSGFYVDTADDDSEKYRQDAESFFDRLTAERLIESQVKEGVSSYHPKGIQDVTVPTEAVKAEQVLLPVWFMSYRDGDHITYATVNGQTGKVVADFPVSPLRYLAASLLTMAVLFVFLNFVFTLKPEWALIVTGCLMLLAFMTGKKPFRKLKNWKKTSTKAREDLRYILLFCVGFSAFGVWLISLGDGGIVAGIFFCVFAVIIAFVFIRGIFEEARKNEQQETVFPTSSGSAKRHADFRLPSWIKVLMWLMLAVNVLCLFLKPVYNMWYYSMCLADAVIIFLIVYQGFRFQRNLARHRPPQFDRNGGQDNA